MKRKKCKTIIDAPGERVLKILWGEETYHEWTTAFAQGSKVKTDWQEGSEILFLNAEDEGMVSSIQEKKEPEKMIFKHLGMIDKEGKVDRCSEHVKGWQGAEEIYILKDFNGKTELTVEMDLDEKQEAFFEEAWPKAFKNLHNLSQSPEKTKQQISVKSNIDAPVEKVLNCWANPENIKQWNHASADWHTPSAENDLRENGKFSYRMEAKDGSAGFDFEGIYDEVDRHRRIKYTLGNGRKVTVSFVQNEN